MEGARGGGNRLPLEHDIRSRTIGVVSYVHVGQEVTRRMQALGMKTIWYDVFDMPQTDVHRSEFRPLDDLLAESDFVTLHANLDESSQHLIRADQLAQMKSTAYLINTARGGLIDQSALTEALKAGTIADAGRDVHETTTPAEDDPIFTLLNVVCFPHIGSASEESRRAKRELAVTNLLAVASEEHPRTAVNPEVLDA